MLESSNNSSCNQILPLTSAFKAAQNLQRGLTQIRFILTAIKKDIWSLWNVDVASGFNSTDKIVTTRKLRDMIVDYCEKKIWKNLPNDRRWKERSPTPRDKYYEYQMLAVGKDTSLGRLKVFYELEEDECE